MATKWLTKDSPITRTARSTGSEVTAGWQDGWTTRCHRHDYTTEHSSRAKAEQALAQPEQWCVGCAPDAAASELWLDPIDCPGCDHGPLTTDHLDARLLRCDGCGRVFTDKRRDG